MPACGKKPDLQKHVPLWLPLKEVAPAGHATHAREPPSSGRGQKKPAAQRQLERRVACGSGSTWPGAALPRQAVHALS